MRFFLFIFVSVNIKTIKTMNKLLFTLEVDFGDNVVHIRTREGFAVELGKLEWITHI